MRHSFTRFSDVAGFAVALVGATIVASAAAQGPHQVTEWLTRATAALAAGDRRTAAAAYLELGERYRQGGDRLSASVADFEAGRVLVELDRFDEAARTLSASREDDPDPLRKAERDRLIVIANERSGKPDAARTALEAARNSLPATVWDRVLREDAIRLGASWRARRWGGVALGLAAIAALLILTWALWQRRRSEIATGGIAFFATVGAVEIALRLLLPMPSEIRHLLHPPSRTTVFHPERGVMPGIDYAESRFTINDAGLRGPPLPATGTTRVLVLGGSTTEGLYLDDKDVWTAVLQAKLTQSLGRPIWVGNAGKSGLTSFAHVIQAHAYVGEIKPEVIIIQAGINDLAACISGERSQIESLAEQFRWPDAWDRNGLGVFSRIAPPTIRNGLRLQLLVDRASDRWNDSTSRAPAVVQDMNATYYHSLRERRAAAEIVDVSPDLDLCLVIYEDNLQRIAGIVLPLGIQLVLVTQGSLYRDPMPPEDEHLLWFGSVDRNMFALPPSPRYYSARVMAHALARYNAVTKTVCAHHGLTCVDADALLPHTTDSYYDDVHMNIGGSRQLGASLADVLTEILRK